MNEERKRRIATALAWIADRLREADVDSDASVRRDIFGVEVPVMPAGALVAYKRHLDRPVDRRDVRWLTEDHGDGR